MLLLLLLLLLLFSVKRAEEEEEEEEEEEDREECKTLLLQKQKGLKSKDLANKADHQGPSQAIDHRRKGVQWLFLIHSAHQYEEELIMTFVWTLLNDI